MTTIRRCASCGRPGSVLLCGTSLLGILRPVGGSGGVFPSWQKPEVCETHRIRIRFLGQANAQKLLV